MELYDIRQINRPSYFFESPKHHKEECIASILEGSKCKIISSGQFSRRRWNGIWADILFEVPFNKLELVTDEIKEKLVKYCDELMPYEEDFDVRAVIFKPCLDIEDKPDIIAELNKTTNAISSEMLSTILNDELIQKGKSMSEVYLYLYCIENSLRIFIEKTLMGKYGDRYFENVSKGIKDKVLERKSNEDKNKWLSLRGNSYLFYLDFKELSSIIKSNWDVFGKYFPSQEWIALKIDELSEVRNLIAHNSYIAEQDRNLMKTYFESIIKQIEQND